MLGRSVPQWLATFAAIGAVGAETNTLTATQVIGFDECDVDGEHGNQKEVDPALVWMGTLLIVAASFLSCFAVNLQKWGLNHRDALPPEEQGPIVKEWRWLLGIVAMIAASLMDLAALPFVPLSRVAALGCSTIVANIVITPLFLGEKLTKHDIGGCAVCVAGTVLACVFGASSEPSVTTGCLVKYFLRDTFIVYGIWMLLFLIFLRYLCEGYRKKKEQALKQNVCSRFECVWVWTNLSMVLEQSGPDHRFFPFVTRFGAQFYPGVHATLGGLCGANSVMFAKTVLICFVNLVKGQEVVSSLAYLSVFLLPFGLCLYMQVGYLNYALAIYCDALFVLPVYQACWIVGGIACGMLLYQEYRSMAALNLILFGCGVLLSLGGLCLLSGREVQGPIASRSGTRARSSGSQSPRVVRRGRGMAWDLSASFLVPGGSILLPLSEAQRRDAEELKQKRGRGRHVNPGGNASDDESGVTSDRFLSPETRAKFTVSGAMTPEDVHTRLDSQVGSQADATITISPPHAANEDLSVQRVTPDSSSLPREYVDGVVESTA